MSARVCVHVSTGVCGEILRLTGVCPQLGLRVLWSLEATEEEPFEEPKPRGRRRGSRQTRFLLHTFQGHPRERVPIMEPPKVELKSGFCHRLAE